MSMGIVSQLPSSHLPIHRVLTKLSNGIASHGENYCQLQLLFLWIITGPFPCVALISFSGRPATWAPAGLGVDVAPCEAPSLSGSCSQSPARPPAPTEARQDSGIYSLLFILLRIFYAADDTARPSILLISFNILAGSYFVPSFKMVKMTRRILQAITTSDCIFFRGLSALVV